MSSVVTRSPAMGDEFKGELGEFNSSLSKKKRRREKIVVYREVPFNVPHLPLYLSGGKSEALGRHRRHWE